jgi:hypothetical protein
MNYEKPTISTSIHAASAIQSGSQKPNVQLTDGGAEFRIQTANAYEADE